MTTHDDLLDGLLSDWATTQRLDDRQAAMIRATVLAPEPAIDADRLWSLLRPVTSLIDRASDESGTYAPYLQLA
jgi:hypothetical protein